MLKKVLLALLFLIIIGAGLIAWIFLTPNTAFEEDKKFLYVRTGQTSKAEVLTLLSDSGYIRNRQAFSLLADRMKIWDRIRPGKYEISKKDGLVEIARMLRNGTQVPVNLVITKVRTREQLARVIGSRFETDSTAMMNFLNHPDSISGYGVDTTTFMSIVFPNTYTYLWAASPRVILDKLYAEHEKFWTEERRELASKKGLTTQQVYTLASIIEEETNYGPEKGNMASVYLNRLNKRMRLGADPTVKFALRDFGLRRIYQTHLQADSPYNTYRYFGLPPGPICTPSAETIEAVLNAPETKYLYFVAHHDFTRKHIFTENYADHLKYARLYRTALDKRQKAQ